MIERIRIANIPIDLFTVESLHETIKNTLVKGQKRLFMHANARLVELANTSEPWLIDFFNKKVDYVICDGAGIQFAAKLSSQPTPIKIAYNVWFWELTKYMVDHKINVFLLGADQKTIRQANTRILNYAPELEILDYYDGYFDKSPGSEENRKIIERINDLRPNILLVGFGMPIQEKWIMENFQELNVNCILSCGGAFDFIAGRNPVAPAFFRKFYLEWFFRLIIEPVRLFKRNTIDLLVFLYVIVRERFKSSKP